MIIHNFQVSRKTPFGSLKKPKKMYSTNSLINGILLFMLLQMIFIINGCDSENETDGHTITIPVDRIMKQINLSDFVDSVKYIPLETSIHSLIGTPGKVEYCNTYFFLSDLAENKVLIFNQKGRYSHAISREGRGPEEYTMINDFTVSPEDTTILIGDSNYYLK